MDIDIYIYIYIYIYRPSSRIRPLATSMRVALQLLLHLEARIMLKIVP